MLFLQAYANVGCKNSTFFARFCATKMLQAVQTDSFCTVWRCKMLFFQAHVKIVWSVYLAFSHGFALQFLQCHICGHWRKSFSFAVRVKMRLYKQVWRCHAGARMSWLPPGAPRRSWTTAQSWRPRTRSLSPGSAAAAASSRSAGCPPWWGAAARPRSRSGAPRGASESCSPRRSPPRRSCAATVRP